MGRAASQALRNPLHRVQPWIAKRRPARLFIVVTPRWPGRRCGLLTHLAICTSLEFPARLSGESRQLSGEATWIGCHNNTSYCAAYYARAAPDFMRYNAHTDDISQNSHARAIRAKKICCHLRHCGVPLDPWIGHYRASGPGAHGESDDTLNTRNRRPL